MSELFRLDVPYVYAEIGAPFFDHWHFLGIEHHATLYVQDSALIWRTKSLSIRPNRIGDRHITAGDSLQQDSPFKVKFSTSGI